MFAVFYKKEDLIVKMRKPSTRFRPLVLLLVLCMLCMSVFASAPPAGEAPPGGPGGPPPDGGAGGPGGPGGPVEELVQSSYFSDVTGEFVDAIAAMYEKGLINGVAAPAARCEAQHHRKRKQQRQQLLLVHL